MCVIHIYANGVPNRHKWENLYPVGHLSLLSPEKSLKVAKFQGVRTERNKRLLLCLLPSADDVQTSPGAGSRCKGTIKFADVQENTDFFFAIFNLEDARGASYSLE